MKRVHAQQRHESRSDRAYVPYVLDQLQSYRHGMTMSLDLVEQAAHRFALLGDPTRLRIMNALMECPELSVGDLARAVSTSRFNASAHLNRLAEAGLLARRRVATTVYYRVDDANLPRVCEWMCESLQARARNLAGAGSA